jgi:hypothetical protein
MQARLESGAYRKRRCSVTKARLAVALLAAAAASDATEGIG